MTLKQELVLKNLAKNGYNISKTMRECGYTQATSLNGTEINRLRRLAKDRWTEEEVRKEIDQHKKACKKANDLANVSRMIELKTKCLGMQRDIKENVNPDTIVIVDKTTASILPKSDNKIE